MTATTTPVKTNLPAEPNAFVGRERDVGDLGRLLESMRAVTLCGAGGIGKTRLALHVAHTMLGAGPDGVDAGPDGVWFVELADVRPDGTTEPVARRVATVLSVAEEDGRPLTETLADALRAPAALIVLDNCEHVIEECAKLTGMLLARCPRLRVLATSREPLRMAGENVWRVPPLEPDEARRLFIDRAKAARPGFDGADAVHEVTRALDGMPLALELAAARVRVLSVEQIARRLTDRFRLLSAGDRTAPARQRTLRAAIDWSHELLDDPERVLLRRLSVFSGWTLEQAEHVCADAELPADDVLDLLTALVDKSLVAVSGELAGEVRFRQLDSIREYAAERLADAGEDETFRGRHRDAVLHAAERHGRIAVARDDAAWAERVALFNWYDVEFGNVRSALTWSLDRGDVREGLRICTALRTFWIVRGRVTEGAGWTDRFLAASHGLGPSVLGPALVARAQLALGGRDYAQAARYADDGLASCRDCGDDFMTASALIAGAECLVRAGRLADAAGRLDEADAIAAAPRQEWNRAYAAAVRGYLLIRGSRLREAREHLDAAATVMRGIGQLWGASHAMIGLGRLAELRGDHASARGHYAEVLPILAEIGARPEMARALAGLGRVALEQDDLHTARESLSQSLTLSRSSGIRLDMSRALDAFADLVAREGDGRGAVILAAAASALHEATGRAPGTGARRERTLEPIRRRLGAPLVAQFWGEGRAMPVDDAIAHALRDPANPLIPHPRPADSEHPTPTDPTLASTRESPSPTDPGRPTHTTDPERTAPTSEPAPPDPAADSGRLAPGRPPPTAAELGLPAHAAEPVTPPSTLTPREREIALLVARGLSNRGVADELVISPATVARHVTNILTKLGFSSRAQIAAWAVDNIHTDPPPP
ncbi:LuxR C-terminal-related transcriptional regulator [Actinomadura sp. 1N219]|uniref:helix-turn-helix transcriptional regulator n=1 Tax=Actinomadura sp. 1N219 TaxID=3375152 RepID=UPI0037BD583C